MDAIRRGRLNEIDTVRGLALAMIFIDHVPGNPLENITIRNFGFADATEIFVFLAGLAAALAYFRKFTADRPWLASAKAAKRGFDLYLVHVFCIAVVAALVAWMAGATADPELYSWINLGPIFNDPAAGLMGVVTLGHQPGYFNILPMYICFMLALPVMMLIARASVGAMLVASATVWVVANMTGMNAPQWPNGGGWFFNPLAWQFVFAIGFVVGAGILGRAQVVPYRAWAWWLAAAYLVLALVMKLAAFYPARDMLPIPFFLYGQDKTFVTLPRILHLLALVYVVAYSPAGRWLRDLGANNPFAVMGRQGLAVFATGSLLAVAAQLVRVPLGGGVVLDVVLVSAGLVILVLLAGGLEWLKRSTAQTSARTATPARTTVAPARTAPAAPSAAVPPAKAFGPVRA
ncbi:OpgC domain-containing protein [Tistrella mobilis]